jgi:hypothetical protein
MMALQNVHVLILYEYVLVKTFIQKCNWSKVVWSFHILIVISEIHWKEKHANKIRSFSKKWRKLCLVAMNYEAPLRTELKVKSDISDFMENIFTLYFEENKLNETLL